MIVKAIDKDIGINGELSYHFKVGGENVQETDDFKINSNTGELRSKKFLDHEMQAKYEVSCEANTFVKCEIINDIENMIISFPLD